MSRVKFKYNDTGMRVFPSSDGNISINNGENVVSIKVWEELKSHPVTSQLIESGKIVLTQYEQAEQTQNKELEEQEEAPKEAKSDPDPESQDEEKETESSEQIEIEVNVEQDEIVEQPRRRGRPPKNPDK